MVTKAPRRTAERILEATLALFNRFGEPNVSTTLIAAELRISPGNLYYHYPSKDTLINALYDRYEQGVHPLLGAASSVRDVEDSWFFLHSLFEHIWLHRFLYRDLSDLLSRNRRLETQFQDLLALKASSMRAMLQSMERAGTVDLQAHALETTATSMVVLLTYWLSYEYVCNPRHALEGDCAQAALLRGAHHALHLLMPYLDLAQRKHLMQLVHAYAQAPEQVR